mgnify:FL=1
MIRMMTAALLLNTDMGIYFFVLPYLSSGLGMSQSEIGLLTAVHSVCYIAVTCLSGMRRNHLCGAFAARWSILLAAAVYLISALCPTRPLLYPLVLLHGLCQGTFWPEFWAFHAARGGNGEDTGLLCNSFIWITMTSVAAPVLAGFLYPLLGRCLLLLAAAMLLPSVVCPPPISPKAAGRAAVSAGGDGSGEDRGSPWADLCRSEQRILLFSGLGGICAAGLAEGAFRATGAFFVRRAGFGASFWGVLLGIRLFAQMAVATALKRSGPEQLAKLRTALIIALSEGALCLCFLLLGNAGRAWTMGIGMALVGTVAGFLHFTALRIGVFASRPGGRNYGGAAECLLGLGTFLGSLFSGFYGTERYGNPFLPVILSAALLSAAVIAILGNHIVRKNLQI